MNKTSQVLKCLILATAGVALLTGMVVAQDDKSMGEQQMPEMGAPKQMDEAKQLVGTWDVDMKFKMDPAGDEWSETKSVATYEMALDGCALISHFEGDMMGMPFKGMAIQAYSREYKEWQTTWIDNMGATITLYTGNEQGDKMVMTAKEKWQGQEYDARITTFNHEENSFDWKYEMSMDGGKTWNTTMESHYTKRK